MLPELGSCMFRMSGMSFRNVLVKGLLAHLKRLEICGGDAIFVRPVVRDVHVVHPWSSNGQMQRHLKFSIGVHFRNFAAGVEVEEQIVEESPETGPQESDNQTVLEYLKSQGINTTALEEVELPKSKDVIKERIEFLTTKIGLTIKDINDYPLMIGCSVQKNLIPVLKYLETHKVTKNSFPVLIRKYPQVLHSSVAIYLSPNVRYIQGMGVELKQIGALLTRYPQVLGFRIEGTMSTSVAYLCMIGVNPRQIGPILTEKPDIMGMRVANNIKPKVEFIASWGIPHLVVGKMIENRPYILGYGLDEDMRPAVDALLDFGVRKEAIPQILVQFPDILGMKVMDKVQTKLPWLMGKVGVRKDSVPQIIEKLPQILLMNVPSGTKRVNALRDLGFTKNEVSDMVVRCPQLLAISVEKAMKPNADFLVKEMKRDIRELLEYPEFLTYDLEGRIRPRFAKILDKGTQWPLAWMLNCSDSKFESRLEIEYTAEMKGEVGISFNDAGRLCVAEEAPEDDIIEEEPKRKTRSKVSPNARTSKPRPTVIYSDDDE